MSRRLAWITTCVVAFVMSAGPGAWSPLYAQDDVTAENQGSQEQAEGSAVEIQEAATEEQASAADSSPSEATEEPEAAPVVEEPSVGQPPASAAAGVISVDFKDADIRQVMRIISLKSGVDIVVGPDVEGLVTIKLTQVPWEQALEIILRTYGFAYERKGNVVRVMTLQAVEQEATTTEVFPLSYAKAKEVTDVVKEILSERGKVKFDERTNTVIVTDLPSNLFQLKQVIERIDQPTPQVHIASQFVETRLTRDENFGVDWFDNISLTVTPPTVPTTFPFPAGSSLGVGGKWFIPRSSAGNEGRVPDVGGTFTVNTISLGTTSAANFNLVLQMLKTRTDTRVISNPTIVTLNNKEALVQVGTDVNIPNFQIDPASGRATVTGFQTRSTGIILKVTPHINPRDEIVMDIKPEITTVGADRTFASGITFPDFDVQKADTQVRLLSGQTLAIGGLKRDAERVQLDKVPWLGDIPVVGWLFTRRREQTPSGQDQLDLLIFLTVNLVKEQPLQEAAIAAQPASP